MKTETFNVLKSLPSLYKAYNDVNDAIDNNKTYEDIAVLGRFYLDTFIHLYFIDRELEHVLPAFQSASSSSRFGNNMLEAGSITNTQEYLVSNGWLIFDGISRFRYLLNAGAHGRSLKIDELIDYINKFNDSLDKNIPLMHKHRATYTFDVQAINDLDELKSCIRQVSNDNKLLKRFDNIYQVYLHPENVSLTEYASRLRNFLDEMDNTVISSEVEIPLQNGYKGKNTDYGNRELYMVRNSRVSVLYYYLVKTARSVCNSSLHLSDLPESKRVNKEKMLLKKLPQQFMNSTQCLYELMKHKIEYDKKTISEIDKSNEMKDYVHNHSVWDMENISIMPMSEIDKKKLEDRLKVKYVINYDYKTKFSNLCIIMFVIFTLSLIFIVNLDKKGALPKIFNSSPYGGPLFFLVILLMVTLVIIYYSLIIRTNAMYIRDHNPDRYKNAKYGLLMQKNNIDYIYKQVPDRLQDTTIKAFLFPQMHGIRDMSIEQSTNEFNAYNLSEIGLLVIGNHGAYIIKDIQGTFTHIYRRIMQNPDDSSLEYSFYEIGISNEADITDYNHACIHENSFSWNLNFRLLSKKLDDINKSKVPLYLIFLYGHDTKVKINDYSDEDTGKYVFACEYWNLHKEISKLEEFNSKYKVNRNDIYQNLKHRCATKDQVNKYMHVDIVDGVKEV